MSRLRDARARLVVTYVEAGRHYHQGLLFDTLNALLEVADVDLDAVDHVACGMEAILLADARVSERLHTARQIAKFEDLFGRRSPGLNGHALAEVADEPSVDTQRHRQHDLRRDVLDGIFYLVKTGCQWRMLPGGFAPWQTVYYYFRQWRGQGLIGRLLSVARRKAREEAGRAAEPSALVIDCQSVPATRAGGCSGFDAYKKVKGRKRHVTLDTQGLLWAIEVHAASEHESQRAFEIVETADQESDRLEVVFADKAYRGDLEDELAETLGLSLEITASGSDEFGSDEPGFAVEPKRWIVERTFGWFGGWRRLSREYERLTETSGAIVRLASLQLALSRLD